MKTTWKRSIGRCFVWLLFGVPMQAALATVIASSSITLSSLDIEAQGTQVLFFGPPDAQAFSIAFNNLGPPVSDGDFASDADVSANASVTFAQGLAAASPSSGTLTAMGSVNLPGANNFAAVTSPGSFANLSRSFGLTGMTGMVNVNFGMTINGALHGFADGLGMFRTDADTSLEIDGTPVLFDLFAMTGGGNFPDSTLPFAETLTTTLLLDASLPHFYYWNGHIDVVTGNKIPEPATLALILTALALLLCCRARASA